MRTRVCDMFGIDLPIFAFSHCRDVVAAVSRQAASACSARWRSRPTSSRSS
jgi:hypothetical protein